jgi:23S rRNA (uracil1939-C5)-methyltransferase
MTGRVEEILPQLAERGERPEILVVDPPRKGCAPETLQAIAKLAPKLIIYVSCNPVTLARDLKTLESMPIMAPADNQGDKADQDFGYKTVQVLPIDLFPQTYHIESVSVLTRKSLTETV